MIINIGEACAEYLLRTVDHRSQELLVKIPRTKIELAKIELILELKHIGIVKHRLHYGLGLQDFRGPIEWGYSRKHHPTI